ncbi:MAG: hypothetical protein Q8928_02095 [Bacteroidota bacterium]|nr:hypothetical protein [Bacteroidota bacterium]
MKKKLCTLSLFLLFIAPAFAQQLDFTASVDTIKMSSGKKGFNVTVEIKGGTPEFQVLCSDKPLWLGGKVIFTGIRITDRKYQINNIALPVFYVCVIDKNKKLSCLRNDGLLK